MLAQNDSRFAFCIVLLSILGMVCMIFYLVPQLCEVSSKSVLSSLSFLLSEEMKKENVEDNVILDESSDRPAGIYRQRRRINASSALKFPNAFSYANCELENDCCSVDPLVKNLYLTGWMRI